MKTGFRVKITSGRGEGGMGWDWEMIRCKLVSKQYLAFYFGWEVPRSYVIKGHFKPELNIKGDYAMTNDEYNLPRIMTYLILYTWTQRGKENIFKLSKKKEGKKKFFKKHGWNKYDKNLHNFLVCKCHYTILLTFMHVWKFLWYKILYGRQKWKI